MLLLLWSSALAFDCLTPQTLQALRGDGPSPHPHAVVAPPRIGQPGPPGPPSTREIYGTPWPDHLETEHFTINWWDPTVSAQTVELTAEALETAFDALVEEQGWPEPVSSDRYYLWVLLDTELSGTGFTTEYYTDEFPEGYPNIYLNPTTHAAYGEAFYRALSAHELMHAIQYAMRDYDWETGGVETWYWEASATHASELAGPAVDGHQYIAAWYATAADLPYDHVDASHEYGMFVLNAWLDDALGQHTMRSVWEAGTARPGEAWPEVMTAATGLSRAEVWAGFTDAYGNGGLPESHLYQDAELQGVLSTSSSGDLPELGTHYWAVEDDARVTPSSDAVVLGGASMAGGAVDVAAGTVLSVTSVSGDASYVLTVSDPVDPGEGEGEGEGAAEDTAEGASGSTGTLSSDAKGGCSVAAGIGAAGWVVGLVAAGRRRR